MRNSIPDDAKLVGKSDEGRKVIVSGFFQGPGVVVYGPYQHPYCVKTKKKRNGKEVLADKKGTSQSLWNVRLKGSGRIVTFNRTEFEFVV